MDLELLKRFYVVAEEKSITKAAKKLNTTQSALSKSMSLFEYNMKTILFERSRRGVELTEKGEALYEHAKTLITQNEVFLKDFKERDNIVEGTISIVAFPYLGAEWLIPAIKSFLENFPKIRVSITVDPDNVLPINYDVGIGGFIPNHSSLIQEELFSDYNQLYASEEYLNKFGVPYLPEDLDHHQLITYKDKRSYHPHRSINLLLHAGKTSLSPLRMPYLEINSLSGMINAVSEGYGIGEIPVFAAKKNPQLKPVLPRIKGNTLPIFFIYQESRKNNKKIQTLCEYLKEYSIKYCKG